MALNELDDPGELPEDAKEPPKIPAAAELRQAALDWHASIAGRTVLHLPTLACGKSKKLWDGDVERWVSPVNGAEVRAPVLELETGHGLLARPDEFAVLSKADERFYAAFVQGLTALIGVASTGAASAGVKQDVGIALVVAALRAQLAVLEAG